MWRAPSHPIGQSTPPLPCNVPTRLPQTYRLISSEGLPPANGCSKSAHPGPPGSEGEGAKEEEMKWVIIRPKVGLERWQMGGWVGDVFVVLCRTCKWKTETDIFQRGGAKGLEVWAELIKLNSTVFQRKLLLLYIYWTTMNINYLLLASLVTGPWPWTSWTIPQECTLHMNTEKKWSAWLFNHNMVN